MFLDEKLEKLRAYIRTRYFVTRARLAVRNLFAHGFATCLIDCLVHLRNRHGKERQTQKVMWHRSLARKSQYTRRQPCTPNQIERVGAEQGPQHS